MCNSDDHKLAKRTTLKRNVKIPAILEKPLVLQYFLPTFKVPKFPVTLWK